MVVFSKGVLGDENALDESDDSRYMNSCECISKDAEVFELQYGDFLREGKKQASWSDICEMINLKREKFA